MIHEHDVVSAVDMLALYVPVGTAGTVLMVFEETSLAYLVEFINETEDTVDILVAFPDEIELI